jgi:hypothetical protein
MKDIKKEYYNQSKKRFRKEFIELRLKKKQQEQQQQQQEEGGAEGAIGEEKEGEGKQGLEQETSVVGNDKTDSDRPQPPVDTKNTSIVREEEKSSDPTVSSNPATPAGPDAEGGRRPRWQLTRRHTTLRSLVQSHIERLERRRELERILSKDNMMYDSDGKSSSDTASDDTERSFTLHREKATMNVDGLINLPRTCSLSEIVPQHMSSIGSLVELSTVSSRTVKSIRLAKQGLSRRLKSNEDRRMFPRSRGDGGNKSDGETPGGGGAYGRRAESEDARFEMFDSMTKASNMVRRQSFPSIDNVLWSQHHIYQGVV